METLDLKVGQKVQFEYWDSEQAKDVFGIGWIRELDQPNNQIICSTTVGLRWMEPAAIVAIINEPKTKQ